MALCAPWASTSDLCLPLPGGLVASDVAGWLMPASEYLYAKTGRQYRGMCARTVRPCAIRRRPSMMRPEWGWSSGWFSFQSGNVFGFPFGFCGCFDGDPLAGTCSCGYIPQVELGASRIASVSSVKVNGAVVPSSAYRIDDHRWLVRTDGDVWPRCQNMLGDPSVDTNTFEVTFIAGFPIPSLGVKAAASLAIELALGCTGSTACRLPKKAQQITRQGVSVQLKNAFPVAGDPTGITEVDYFIQSVNPNGITRRAIVVNPDTIGAVRHVGSHGGS